MPVIAEGWHGFCIPPFQTEQEANVYTRNSGFRLSRISYPRATLWAMILLTIVFLSFGLVAQAYVPALEPAVGGPGGFDAGQTAPALPAFSIPGN